MKRYLSYLPLFIVSLPMLSLAGQLDLSGEASLENRYFPKEGLYGNTDQSQVSLLLEPNATYSWDDDRKLVQFKPFMRVDDPDKERTHFDVRELSFVGAYNDLEIRAGISKVFWGVTESVHLIDVINQTDFVENIDGEDKLGQPMVNLNYQTSLGNFQGYILPYFRERTFSGANGRYRGPLVIDTDKDALYTHKDKEEHIDYALRWSHYIGNLDLGLSAFKGTNRDPFFVQENGKLTPLYTQMEQYSFDAQYIVGNWLLKSEIMRRDSEKAKAYISTVSGFEYTFSNIKQSGVDLGLIGEWIYDERRFESQIGFYDHSFLGTRVALNDVNSTEFLAGGLINNETGDLSSFRVEASRRINNNWKWEAEVNIIDSPVKDNNLFFYKNDDYLQLKISYFW